MQPWFLWKILKGWKRGESLSRKDWYIVIITGIVLALFLIWILDKAQS